MRVDVWADGERFVTFYDVERAYYWCIRNLGEPGKDKRWTYGKSVPDFLGNYIISSPMEIDYFEFSAEDDLVAFRLGF